MDTTSQTTLTRLLTKLDHSLLDPTSADPRLRPSQYERNRVSANIEYARTLLLTLEKQSATVRAQMQRQLTQAELQRKREVIKRLQARLQELNQLDEADDDEDESDDDDEDGEDVEGEGGLLAYAPARKDTEAGLDTGDPQGPRVDAPQAQEIRNRRPLNASDNLNAASSTAREQLFTGRTKQSEPTTSDLNRTEALMSHNRTEQETLTTGLIGLARALKESSLQFSPSLEAEKDVLKRAEGGLDKSSQGMEAADQRMGMLRRMSEGQGWWGRIKLYAFIFGLWIACFLLVFIGPKLRF
ncbi:hypothetical protein B0A55_09355 [Friedmanniomyces simplex]|uniref:Synaptobrevin n=1 Tax=Friedmanniomyces simplex TaxID=329884 RepID=A0A4U0WQ16_9PEZI|nr:hypothetical protein B0A55_09355 [Friedmanniomyces simplex]